MDRIDEIRSKRKAAHAKLMRLDSKVYKAFLEMEKVTYADGALPKKAKELIALGISVVLDCESCMEWHIGQAVQAGATEREILEAVEVGMEMGGGRATVSARFALEIMERAFEARPAPPSTT
jgi:AhpD family alkylhydroperoxidase